MSCLMDDVMTALISKTRKSKVTTAVKTVG